MLKACNRMLTRRRDKQLFEKMVEKKNRQLTDGWMKIVKLD